MALALAFVAGGVVGLMAGVALCVLLAILMVLDLLGCR